MSFRKICDFSIREKKILTIKFGCGRHQLEEQKREERRKEDNENSGSKKKRIEKRFTRDMKKMIF